MGLGCLERPGAAAGAVRRIPRRRGGRPASSARGLARQSGGLHGLKCERRRVRRSQASRNRTSGQPLFPGACVPLTHRGAGKASRGETRRASRGRVGVREGPGGSRDKDPVRALGCFRGVRGSAWDRRARARETEDAESGSNRDLRRSLSCRAGQLFSWFTFKPR